MIYLGKDRVNLNPNFAASSPAGLGAQADWAETDETASGYIANKPFGYVIDKSSKVQILNSDLENRIKRVAYAQGHSGAPWIKITTLTTEQRDNLLNLAFQININLSNSNTINYIGSFIAGQFDLGGSDTASETFSSSPEMLLATQSGFNEVYLVMSDSLSNNDIINTIQDISFCLMNINTLDSKFIDTSHLYITAGNNSGTIGYHATIEGTYNTATEENAHAEGSYNRVSAQYSHAEGYSNQVSVGANSAHAEGRNNIVQGYASHAEGANNRTSDYYAHAEGNSATASGQASHAEGTFTTASAKDSHAEGSYTTAASICQHAQGRYNIIDNQNLYADIVGNGYSDSHRSNAYTLDWEGNGWFANSVTVGTDPVDSMNLTTKRYVDNLLTPTFNIVATKNSNQLIEIKALPSSSAGLPGAYIWEINMDGTKTTLFSINSILTLNTEQTAAYDAAITVTVQVALGYSTSNQVTLKGE